MKLNSYNIKKCIWLVSASFALFLLASTFASALNVTLFNNSFPEISLNFNTPSVVNQYFLRIPNGTVTEARMSLHGFDLLGQRSSPADIVIVTDVSGSMAGANLAGAQNAARIFLDNVDLTQTQVGLVSYATCPSPILDVLGMTFSRPALDAEINSYVANGWTNMGRGMQLANQELTGSRNRPNVPKFMIVMTDGMANYWYNGTHCLSASSAQAQNYVRNMAAQARANNITIYGIAFGSGADTALVRNITTNGVLYFAPDSATLQSIYAEIANQISEQNFSTPNIRSSVPLSRQGWSISTPYSGDAIWDGPSCGVAGAVCVDYVNLVQQNLNACSSYPCDISFTVSTQTVGSLNLSDLYIEINEPPVGNAPPSGSCLPVNLNCTRTGATIGLENASIVFDPNDDLDTLNWELLGIVPPSPPYLLYNSNFNITRSLLVNVTGNPASTSAVMNFRVSDPWGASANACFNIDYTQCSLGPASQINISNVSISFDYTQFPGYSYDLTSMVTSITGLNASPSGLTYTLGSITGFSISGPTPAGVVTIIPTNPDWLNNSQNRVLVTASFNGTVASAYLTISYSAATGSITCADTPPRVLLSQGNPEFVSFSSIFNFNGDVGNVVSADLPSSADVSSSANIPSGVTLTALRQGSGTLRYRVTMSSLITSPYCDVEYLSLFNNCDKPECDACVLAEDYNCLRNNGCIDGQIRVFNPHTSVNVYRDLMQTRGPSNFIVDSYDVFGGFSVLPGFGNQATVFRVNDTDGSLMHGTMDGSAITISYPAYSGWETRICPALQRYQYTLADVAFDPNTSLLVTGSRAVFGFYEDSNGDIYNRGPFIFVAKAWVRD